ncbi:hypothetical protein DOY81_011180, partial [Sarcophaga bullata]
QQQQQQQHGLSNMDKRHSNSQSSIVGLTYTGGLQHAQSQSSIASSSHLLDASGVTHHCPPAPNASATNTMDRLYYTAVSSNGNLSTQSHNGNDSEVSSTTGQIRATTLPRGNNNNYDESTGDFIQISGLDTNSAFVRKSPTPLLKNNHQQHQSGGGGGVCSQAIPRESNPNSNMPMNLEDLDDLFKYAEEHAVVGEVQTMSGNNKNKEQLSGKTSHGSSSGYQSINTQINMETQQQHQQQKTTVAAPLAFKNPSYQLQNTSSNSSQTNNHHHHHHHHHHQQQQLQNSSNNQNQRSVSGGGGGSGGLTAHQQLFGNTRVTKNSNTGGLVAARAALLNRAAPLTPSSSEERLSNDNYHSYAPVNKLLKSPSHGHLDAQRTLSGGSTSSASSTNMPGFNSSSATAQQQQQQQQQRMPRTNPLIKREDIYAPLNNGSNYLTSSSASSAASNGLSHHQHPGTVAIYNNGGRPGHHHQQQSQYGHNAGNMIMSGNGVRYQRRLSLDSARTLSDSSTDTEGHCGVPHENNKRRRQPRSHINSTSNAGSGGNAGSIGYQHVSNSTALSSYDQNGEIQLLQETLDTLRHTLDRDEAELRDSSDELFALQRCNGFQTGSNNGCTSLAGNNLSLQSESTMRSIIDR